jgi:hypothetical protein
MPDWVIDLFFMTSLTVIIGALVYLVHALVKEIRK